ncbi:MAG: hypothetical protein Tsb009_07290 [Planctomycetaceae bacterium]
MSEEIKIQILDGYGSSESGPEELERARRHLDQIKEIAKQHNVVAILISPDPVRHSPQEYADKYDLIFAIRFNPPSRGFRRYVEFAIEIEEITGLRICPMDLDQEKPYIEFLRLDKPYNNEIGPPVERNHSPSSLPKNDSLASEGDR